jgi:hypothetical protein
MARNTIFLGADASAAEGAPIQTDLFKSYFNIARNPSGKVLEITSDLETYFCKFTQALTIMGYIYLMT